MARAGPQRSCEQSRQRATAECCSSQSSQTLCLGGDDDEEDGDERDDDEVLDFDEGEATAARPALPLEEEEEEE